MKENFGKVQKNPKKSKKFGYHTEGERKEKGKKLVNVYAHGGGVGM